MDYILPGLVTLVILLFLFRRQIKRAWNGEARPVREDSNKTFADIVARERARVQDQAKDAPGTGDGGAGGNEP